MKSHWMITTAAAAILASTGFASAQGTSERGGKAPGAAMEKSTPDGSGLSQGRDRGQGGAMRGESAASKSSETTGQAPQSGQKKPSGTAQNDMQREKSGTTGQAPSAGQKDSGAAAMDKKSGAGTAEKSGTDKTQQSGAEQRQGSDTRNRTETTGRGDAAAAKLSTEQRTKIRQVVVSKKIPKVTNVNFSISVGAAVPRTVRFHPIPVEIVEIYPAWRGYRVVLVDGELIIVHPRSYRIVAVIAV